MFGTAPNSAASSNRLSNRFGVVLGIGMLTSTSWVLIRGGAQWVYIGLYSY